MDRADDAITLRDYLEVVWRRRWIILAVALVVPAVAVALALREDPAYEASAKVLLAPQSLASALTGIEDPNSAVTETTLTNTQAEVARSPQIEERVRDELGLDDRPDGFLFESSEVTASDDSQILTFTVESGDAELASSLTNSYASQYTRFRRELDTAPLESALEGLRERLAELREQGEDRGPLFQELLSREGTLAAMQALETSNARVIDPAGDADQVSPSPVRDGVIGLMLGLVLGLGLAFVRESLDTRIRDAEEISDRLELPLVARLPAPPKETDANDTLITLDDPSGMHAEAFRILRTNLEFALLDGEVKSVLVTSALEGEGKSTTVANLGLAFARAGRDVIVADFDLRLPRQSRFFDLEGRPGATDVLLGRKSLDEALVEVPILPAGFGASAGEDLGEPGLLTTSSNGASGTLSVLNSGALPPDPGEVVASNRIDDLVSRLTERCDLLLVDSPPLIHVGDAITLSGRLDGVCLVVRLEAAHRSVLAEARRVLHAAKARELGFILTGAETEAGYGYGYGYGAYHRHYGREPEREEGRVA